MAARAIAILALLLSTSGHAQGVLRSHIIGGDSTRCALVIRSFDNWATDAPRILKVSKNTYLLAGDYLVTYTMNDTMILHKEWIHIPRTTGRGVDLRRFYMDKWILVSPRALTGVSFYPVMRLE